MNAALLYLVLALVAGCMLPTQAGINAQLNLWARSPVLAAGISFAVGTLALFVYGLVTRIPLPPLALAAAHPWWIWTGGLLGAYFVAATVVLAPKVGATTLVVLILAGQVLASLVIDHFGWLGYPVHPLTLARLAGVGLVGAGVWLVRSF